MPGRAGPRKGQQERWKNEGPGATNTAGKEKWKERQPPTETAACSCGAGRAAAAADISGR